MDRTEGASGLDQLHQFGVADEKPLQAVGVRLDEGVKSEVGKDRVGEKVSGDFDKLGKGKGGA